MILNISVFEEGCILEWKLKIIVNYKLNYVYLNGEVIG